MKATKHILLTMNADSDRNSCLIKKLIQHRDRCKMRISILFVTPEISTLSYNLSLALAGYQVSIITNGMREDHETGLIALQQLSSKLGVAVEDQFLVMGNWHTVVSEYLTKLQPDVVIGYRPSLTMLFKRSGFCRILATCCKYTVALFNGFRLNFRGCNHKRPIFLR